MMHFLQWKCIHRNWDLRWSCVSSTEEEPWLKQGLSTEPIYWEGAESLRLEVDFSTTIGIRHWADLSKLFQSSAGLKSRKNNREIKLQESNQDKVYLDWSKGIKHIIHEKCKFTTLPCVLEDTRSLWLEVGLLLWREESPTLNCKMGPNKQLGKNKAEKKKSPLVQVQPELETQSILSPTEVLIDTASEKSPVSNGWVCH